MYTCTKISDIHIFCQLLGQFSQDSALDCFFILDRNVHDSCVRLSQQTLKSLPKDISRNVFQLTSPLRPIGSTSNQMCTVQCLSPITFGGGMASTRNFYLFAYTPWREQLTFLLIPILPPYNVLDFSNWKAVHDIWSMSIRPGQSHKGIYKLLVNEIHGIDFFYPAPEGAGAQTQTSQFQQLSSKPLQGGQVINQSLRKLLHSAHPTKEKLNTLWAHISLNQEAQTRQYRQFLRLTKHQVQSTELLDTQEDPHCEYMLDVLHINPLNFVMLSVYGSFLYEKFRQRHVKVEVQEFVEELSRSYLSYVMGQIETKANQATRSGPTSLETIRNVILEDYVPMFLGQNVSEEEKKACVGILVGYFSKQRFSSYDKYVLSQGSRGVEQKKQQRGGSAN